MRSIDYFKDKQGDIYKVDHNTRDAWLWHSVKKKWARCYKHVYNDITIPFSYKNLNWQTWVEQYRMISEKEAFIEIL